MRTHKGKRTATRHSPGAYAKVLTPIRHCTHLGHTPRHTFLACTSASMRCRRDSGLRRRVWPPRFSGSPLRAARPAGPPPCPPASLAASIGSVPSPVCAPRSARGLGAEAAPAPASDRSTPFEVNAALPGSAVRPGRMTLCRELCRAPAAARRSGPARPSPARRCGALPGTGAALTAVTLPRNSRSASSSDGAPTMSSSSSSAGALPSSLSGAGPALPYAKALVKRTNSPASNRTYAYTEAICLLLQCYRASAPGQHAAHVSVTAGCCNAAQAGLCCTLTMPFALALASVQRLLVFRLLRSSSMQ